MEKIRMVMQFIQNGAPKFHAAGSPNVSVFSWEHQWKKSGAPVLDYKCLGKVSQ